MTWIRDARTQCDYVNPHPAAILLDQLLKIYILVQSNTLTVRLFIVPYRFPRSDTLYTKLSSLDARVLEPFFVHYSSARKIILDISQESRVKTQDSRPLTTRTNAPSRSSSLWHQACNECVYTEGRTVVFQGREAPPPKRKTWRSSQDLKGLEPITRN
ncbi:hypothetical protein EAF00_000896 [Botryotinia globosa]|nr:hypothetical protein EAF00_000896 [Botryotinia globosa]